jgi:hypothetical protein
MVKRVGIKLIVIRRVLGKLIMFMSIMVLFMFAAGISWQALTYHNLPLEWSLVPVVFLPAFFTSSGWTDNYVSYLQCKKT